MELLEHGRTSFDALLQDVRHAWRRARRAPVLTLVVVCTLALGIGANAAIFSIVHALLVRPLPYRDAGRLAFIWGSSRGPMGGPDYRALRTESATLSEIGGIWASGTVALTGDGDPEQLRSAFVTTNFFDVLGAGAAFGRTFRSEDNLPGAPPTILIGWDLFVRRFGGDPSIVGRQVVVNDTRTAVIGVMPQAFRLLLPPDAAVPDRLQAWTLLWPEFEDGPRGNRFLRVVARLRPSATIDDARADVAAIGARLAGPDPAGPPFIVMPLQADDVRDVRAPLLALFGGVGILLAIACVNVGGLLVARAAAQAHETSLRVALGATPGHLVRQWITEGLLLTLGGAAAGLVLGSWALRVLQASAPQALTRVVLSRFDPAVLVFTVGASALWGVLLSLAPAIELARAREGMSNLASGARLAGAAGPSRRRAHGAIVAAQVGLSLVLLAGAGLLVRAFVAALGTDPGFQSAGRLTFRVALPETRYPDTDAVLNASRALRERLAAIPGVASVGAISHLPYDDLPNWALAYSVPSRTSDDQIRRADTRSVSAGIFGTLGVSLLEGRVFTDDERDAGPTVLVDDRLATRLWPQASAVGQELVAGQALPNQRARVIGVFRHLRLRDPLADLAPQLFIPYQQWQRSPMAYVLRTSGDPARLTAQVREAVASVDPLLPIYDVRPMDDYVRAALSVRRFTTALAIAFAGAALALTGFGIYGLLAYTVEVRRREFGVRRALGAGRAQITRTALGEVMLLTMVGCAGGLAAMAVVAGLLRSQLYTVAPYDPLTYASAVVIVVVGAVCACWIPVRRATAVCPMDALRAE